MRKRRKLPPTKLLVALAHDARDLLSSLDRAGSYSIGNDRMTAGEVAEFVRMIVREVRSTASDAAMLAMLRAGGPNALIDLVAPFAMCFEARCQLAEPSKRPEPSSITLRAPSGERFNVKMLPHATAPRRKYRCPHAQRNEPCPILAALRIIALEQTRRSEAEDLIWSEPHFAFWPPREWPTANL